MNWHRGDLASGHSTARIALLWLRVTGRTRGRAAGGSAMLGKSVSPKVTSLAVGSFFLRVQVYALGALRHSAIWAVLSLAVFWFSASGGMYNIIRGMPFFIRDRNGRLQVCILPTHLTRSTSLCGWHRRQCSGFGPPPQPY